MSEATARRKRQGPRALRARRRAAAARRERPHLDLRRRPPDRDPRQGTRAHRPVGLLVRAHARTSSPNHLLALRDDGRSTECQRLEMLPIECVVRGYLSGSGWKDYLATGAVCGHRAAGRARRVAAAAASRSSRRRRRRETGHDENIDRAAAVELVGEERFDEVEATALALYGFVSELRRASAGSSSPTRSSSSASTRTGGSCSATRRSRPTRRASGRPTSTRPARRPPSFDKQFVRDYCESLGWDKTDPGPELPDDVVDGHARTLRRGVRAADGDRVRRRTSPTRAWCSDEGDGARPAEAGDPRPAGPGGRELAAPPRLRRSARPASAGSSTSSSRPTTATRRARSSSACASSCSTNPLIESYEIELERRVT